MKNKIKTILVISLCMVIVSAISVAGTIAFLSSETEASGGVGTVGKVDIRINEYQRVDDAENQHQLTQYVNGAIYPTYYSGNAIDWAPSDEWVVKDDLAWRVVSDNDGVVDKFVTVTNTGSNSAYVRTIIAFEAGENAVVDPYLHIVVNDKKTTDEIGDWEWLDGYYDINGRTCSVAVVTYKNPLAPGETTVPSLKQVYLDKKVTNEICEALGENLDIYVKAQAVQSENMGELTAEEALFEAFGAVDPVAVFAE